MSRAGQIIELETDAERQARQQRDAERIRELDRLEAAVDHTRAKLEGAVSWLAGDGFDQCTRNLAAREATRANLIRCLDDIAAARAAVREFWRQGF